VRQLFWLLPLFFIVFVSILDRRLFKESQGFCLHIIEAPIPSTLDPNPSLPFPKELFAQPFRYLGKGAQSFVFESSDQTAVLKFYRFPSHLRRFPWTRHPFGYLFSSTRQNIKEYNLRRLKLSFHSFFLAAHSLQDETGVLYAHLQPTQTLNQKVQLIDKLGAQYDLSLDSVAFVVQKKGVSFLPRFKEQLTLLHKEECKHMLKSLVSMIQNRCMHNISDLDNMDNDNYGWLENRAIHLDIGRFQEKELANNPLKIREEILRVTHPLMTHLSEAEPALHAYFLNLSECAPE
jgi:hypothetical protein